MEECIKKQRHGCVTFWLWLVLFLNVGYSLSYIVALFRALNPSMFFGLALLALCGVGYMVSAILLLRWNRWGFYLMILSSMISLIVNLMMNEIPLLQTVSSLLGIFIWWALLQIRYQGISVWKQLTFHSKNR